MAVPQKQLCRIEKISSHGDQVYTVELTPERPVPRFRPGQFLHLALDPYDPSGFWPESRVFSIASSPQQRNVIRISYSVRGRFTARMERELRQGGEVWIKLPYGDFVIQPGQDIVLLAGGTGITAFTAFLDGLTPALDNHVYLAYGARNPELLIYRGLVQNRSQEIDRLKAFYFIEEGSADSDPSVPGDFFAGKISLERIWSEIRNPKESTFYISGPPVMLKALSGELTGAGVAAHSIQIDAWE